MLLNVIRMQRLGLLIQMLQKLQPILLNILTIRHILPHILMQKPVKAFTEFLLLFLLIRYVLFLIFEPVLRLLHVYVVVQVGEFGFSGAFGDFVEVVDDVVDESVVVHELELGGFFAHLLLGEGY
jgi:hypothetical protein